MCVKVCASNNIQYNNSNSVNFTGYRTLLGKKLDEVLRLGNISFEDNEFLVRELKKLLEKRLNQAQNLGEGMSNRVYKIDNKYALRVPINKTMITDNKVILQERKFNNLKMYYGEPVATIGNIQIMKNASSNGSAIPAGVPKKLPESFDKSDIHGYYSRFYLPLFAGVPQRSYNALARDMKTLASMAENQYAYFTFDYFNPNNVVLTGKTLKMTDDIDKTIWKSSNTMSDMLNVFLKQVTVGIPATPSSVLTPLRQQIARKVLKAGMKCDLSITGEDKPNNVFNFVIKYLCTSKEEPQKVFETLSDIQKAQKTPRQKCAMLDRYLDEIFRK